MWDLKVIYHEIFIGVLDGVLQILSKPNYFTNIIFTKKCVNFNSPEQYKYDVSPAVTKFITR